MDQGFYQEPESMSDDQLDVKPDADGIDTDMSPSEFGFGSNPFQRPIEAVNARIKQGVGYIDIPFFGQGKGNKERYTPESISKKERRDIEELAKINDVKLSTHASTNIQGLAGMGQQGFEEKHREDTLKEIKKAVDFASDLQGGAVVFHTGEFPRNFSEQDWGDQFEQFPTQEERDVVHMVDERTGDIIGSVRKNKTVHEPKYKKGKDVQRNTPYTDAEGNVVHADDYVDAEGNKIDPSDTEEMLKRVPLRSDDQEEGYFETKRLEWDDFKERAQEYGTSPEEEFYKSQIQEQILQARGQSFYHAQHYEDMEEAYDEVKEALEFYEDLEEDIPEEEKWKIMQDAGYGRAVGPSARQLVGPNRKTPREILESQLEQIQMQMKHTHSSSASADVRAEEQKENLKHIKPIADYGVDKSADTIARAAEYAYQKTRQKDPEREIYVSPESFQPESYGSHPDEMRELIEKSREQFVERMKTKNGIREDKARELAKEHIKGTLDTGHFNMWRQHFKGDEDMSEEERDEAFKEWYINEVEDLVKSDMVGQVHITDNMGFDDEHLSPGQGNVPMDEVMDIIEEAGMDDVIVEAGSFNPVDVVPETFEYFGSPIYGASAGTPTPTPAGPGGSFRDVYQSHFGYQAPPFYVVGAYAPSNEWQLWSEVQME